MLNSHRGLLDLIYQFLEHIVWEKEKSQLARKVCAKRVEVQRLLLDESTVKILLIAYGKEQSVTMLLIGQGQEHFVTVLLIGQRGAMHYIVTHWVPVCKAGGWVWVCC